MPDREGARQAQQVGQMGHLGDEPEPDHADANLCHLDSPPAYV